MRPRLTSRSGRLARVTVTVTTLALAAGSMALSTGPASASTSIAPNRAGGLDCNGLSHIQTAVRRVMTCADPRVNPQQRFEDNGTYIGHDEPTVRFLSNAAGSGNSFSITEVLGKDPAANPTVATPGSDNTHYFELSPAPWFSINLCDPNSFPQLPCTPNSDSNAPNGRYPGGGAAFMELQFYPPGFAPFADADSCDNSHWCSALNVDSLACAANGTCNNNCVEPVNFAFVQTDGVPTGPPSPQLTDLATFTPNAHTLLMNPGDSVTVDMFDATISGGHAFEVRETDHTTGTSGFMIASAANGFTHTSIVDCSGTPFNYEPEYSSARAANILPWGSGPYDINTEFEIGHFEPCTAVSGKAATPLGTFSDTYYKHCAGPYEAAKDSTVRNEVNDAPCYRAGDTHGGAAPPDEVTGCIVFFSTTGDLDYDGSAYRADWPTSTTPNSFPATFLQQQPTSHGATYPQVQFETDMSATEPNCNLATGKGCVMPPPGPGHFYPFWTMANVNGTCVWEFGNMHNGNDFGGDEQYGSVTPTTIGAFAGPIRDNPSCAAAA